MSAKELVYDSEGFRPDLREAISEAADQWEVRVSIESGGRTMSGVYIGLMSADDRGGDTLVVVRLDGFGPWVRAYHPSKVKPEAPNV